jgi:hypothetical protein
MAKNESKKPKLPKSAVKFANQSPMPSRRSTLSGRHERARTREIKCLENEEEEEEKEIAVNSKQKINTSNIKFMCEKLMRAIESGRSEWK